MTQCTLSGTAEGDLSHLFRGCFKLKSADLSNLDTSKVTNMSNMFSITGLTSLDLSSFNTSNVTDMSNMFYGCSLLGHIYVSSKFVTTKVTSSYSMFIQCTRLPNFVESKIDKTMAYIGGYLEQGTEPAPAPSELNIKLGTTKISKVYLGTTQIKKIFKGLNEL